VLKQSVEKTVRKLKTEQANSGGSSSLGVEQRERRICKIARKKKIPRPNNIFKRI
jgi:hypothetical protein